MGRSRDPYLEKMLRAVPLLPILLGPMVMRHSVLSAIVIAVTSFALWHAVRDVPHQPVSIGAGVAAVLAPRSRRLLFVGATYGNRPPGAKPPADEREQCGHALENLGEALEAAGFGWRDVARLRVNATSESALAAYRSARDSALGEDGVLLPRVRARGSNRGAARLDVAETLTIVKALRTPFDDPACVQIEADAAR